MPSLRGHNPCTIQTGNNLHHSNSVAFGAKKAKETLMMRFCGNTITITITVTIIITITTEWTQ